MLTHVVGADRFAAALYMFFFLLVVCVVCSILFSQAS